MLLFAFAAAFPFLFHVKMRRAGLLALLSSVGLSTASSPAPSLAQLSFFKGLNNRANSEEPNLLTEALEEKPGSKESPSETALPPLHQTSPMAGDPEQGPSSGEPPDLNATGGQQLLDEGAVPAANPVSALPHDMSIGGDDAAVAAAASALPILPSNKENQLIMFFERVTQLFLAMRRRLD